jgi:AcrR family transcriptional regulator
VVSIAKVLGDRSKNLAANVAGNVAANVPAARNLSTVSVVDTGLRLADREGMSAVTLGRIARELGCHVTSLYTHVESIDDLHMRMAVQVQHDLGQQLWHAALGRSGVDALRALAAVYRGFGEARPVRTWLLFAMTAKADQRFRDGAVFLVEPIRVTLRSFGLEEHQVVHAHRSFSASMRGFLLAEAQGAYGDDADATFENVVALYTLALGRGDWPVP